MSSCHPDCKVIDDPCDGSCWEIGMSDADLRHKADSHGDVY